MTYFYYLHIKMTVNERTVNERKDRHLITFLNITIYLVKLNLILFNYLLKIKKLAYFMLINSWSHDLFPVLPHKV